MAQRGSGAGFRYRGGRALTGELHPVLIELLGTSAHWSTTPDFSLRNLGLLWRTHFSLRDLGIRADEK